ncbi:MAG: NAD(P)-dependent oxidoreductase [Burkholderiales bacterium]|nr:NAD(P)-dependent oxidoreductase [Burkholderiales bacterium]
MRIAVLGASGVAGRAFTTIALGAGHELVTDRADLFDRSALERMLGGCDAAVNLATSIPRPGGRGDWAVNDRIRREGTANLIEACLAARVPLLLQQSVAMLLNHADDRPQVEDDAIHGYGRIASAADMEALVRAAPLDGRLVRGGLFYGPGTGRAEAWAAELADPGFRIPGDGSAWISPVHVEDYATALLAVLLHGRPREAVNACEDEPLRLTELYAGLARRSGRNTPDSGGPPGLRSFRVANKRLRDLGWQPRHALRASFS